MYGGIQKISTHLSITNQLLINDYITLKKALHHITQYDPANCFDRMIPNLTAIALTRLGSPKQIGIQLAINSLNTSHRITSKEGISKEKISRPKMKTWSGIGQGNSVSGPSWLALEAPKIITYDDPKTQFKSINPSNNTNYSNSIFAYIDDNNTSKTFPPHTSTNEIIQQNNQNTIKWEHILKA